jgi:hypothetical protein
MFWLVGGKSSFSHVKWMRFSDIWLESDEPHLAARQFYSWASSDSSPFCVSCRYSPYRLWTSSFIYPVTFRTFNYTCIRILCRNATIFVLLNNGYRYILVEYFYKRCYDLKPWWITFLFGLRTPNTDILDVTWIKTDMTWLSILHW